MTQVANRRSPWWHRSWAWAAGLFVISVLTGLVAGKGSWAEVYFAFPVLCLWLWLLVASWLTDYADALLEDCKIQLEDRKRPLGGWNTLGQVRGPGDEAKSRWTVPPGAGWFEFKVRGRGVRVFAFVFVPLGFAAGVMGLVIPSLGAEANPNAFGAALLATATIAVVFWFAAIGFHGACASLGLVCTVARRNTYELYVFHGDRQGGLGPLVRLADVAGLFICTGALALPMGVRIAEYGLEQWQQPGSGRPDLGYLTAVIAILAIVIWALFVVGASIVGRVELAHAVARFRDTARMEFVRRRDGTSEERQALEAAINNLNVGGLDAAGWITGLRNLIVAGAAIAGAVYGKGWFN